MNRLEHTKHDKYYYQEEQEDYHNKTKGYIDCTCVCAKDAYTKRDESLEIEEDSRAIPHKILPKSLSLTEKTIELDCPGIKQSLSKTHAILTTQVQSTPNLICKTISRVHQMANLILMGMTAIPVILLANQIFTNDTIKATIWPAAAMIFASSFMYIIYQSPGIVRNQHTKDCHTWFFSDKEITLFYKESPHAHLETLHAEVKSLIQEKGPRKITYDLLLPSDLDSCSTVQKVKYLLFSEPVLTRDKELFFYTPNASHSWKDKHLEVSLITAEEKMHFRVMNFENKTSWIVALDSDRSGLENREILQWISHGILKPKSLAWELTDFRKWKVQNYLITLCKDHYFVFDQIGGDHNYISLENQKELLNYIQYSEIEILVKNPLYFMFILQKWLILDKEISFLHGSDGKMIWQVFDKSSLEVSRFPVILEDNISIEDEILFIKNFKTKTGGTAHWENNPGNYPTEFLPGYKIELRRPAEMGHTALLLLRKDNQLFWGKFDPKNGKQIDPLNFTKEADLRDLIVFIKNMSPRYVSPMHIHLSPISYPSQMDPTKQITWDQSAITFINSGTANILNPMTYGGHAALIIEQIENGYYSIYKVHLTNEHGVICAKKRAGKIFENGKLLTYLRNRKLVDNIWQEINLELAAQREGDPIVKFTAYPSQKDLDSVPPKHNCATYCINKLDLADIHLTVAPALALPTVIIAINKETRARNNR